MNRPARVKIAGRRWLIEYQRRTEHHVYGMTYYDEHRIVIRDGLLPIEEADTLIHEVMHALIASAGITVPDTEEEPIVRAMASGLTGVLADNPGLRRYINYLLNRK
ncbi:hypothetical protein RSB1_gp39 [Ralstonia phage RSB1]|uniref:Uncharacterized protein n=1 Tax=Ralstonia phage RSB1 TaxID=551790 RepID=B5BTX5_9CAUD|nr:hypothetical protein RSB1_gp39 [Ralstonia phage RSB1]BAG70397.1 hypothetical protein [Ralstonia phage RSB1]